MRLVKVYGQLAKRLGQKVFKVDVATPGEAVRFLCANFPGLDQWLIDSEKDGVGYRVKVSKISVGYDELSMGCDPAATISITPVLAGAGGGTGQVLAGIGLVAASILLAPVGGGFLGLGAGLAHAAGGAVATGIVSAGVATAIGTIGASLILGGTAQLLSPKPPALGGINGQSVTNDPRRLQSYNINGIQNTSTQGTPLNVVYGKMFVGSVTLSAGLHTTSLS